MKGDLDLTQLRIGEDVGDQHHGELDAAGTDEAKIFGPLTRRSTETAGECREGGELERLGELRLGVDPAEAARRQRPARHPEAQRVGERIAGAEPAQEAGGEAVAGAGAVDRLDPGRGRPCALGAAPRDRTLGAERHDDGLDSLGEGGERRLGIPDACKPAGLGGVR